MYSLKQPALTLSPLSPASLGIHKTIFFMASMAYAIKAEPAENEALKGEGVKRSRKLYWPVGGGSRERVKRGEVLLELADIK